MHFSNNNYTLWHLEKRLIDLSDFILIRRSQVTGKLRRSRVPNILGFHNGVKVFLRSHSNCHEINSKFLFDDQQILALCN